MKNKTVKLVNRLSFSFLLVYRPRNSLNVCDWLQHSSIEADNRKTNTDLIDPPYSLQSCLFEREKKILLVKVLLIKAVTHRFHDIQMSLQCGWLVTQGAWAWSWWTCPEEDSEILMDQLIQWAISSGVEEKDSIQPHQNMSQCVPGKGFRDSSTKNHWSKSFSHFTVLLPHLSIWTRTVVTLCISIGIQTEFTLEWTYWHYFLILMTFSSPTELSNLLGSDLVICSRNEKMHMGSKQHEDEQLMTESLFLSELSLQVAMSRFNNKYVVLAVRQVVLIFTCSACHHFHWNKGMIYSYFYVW